MMHCMTMICETPVIAVLTQVCIISQIIAQAGLPGSITIATNMAGRGTDIILGGNPEGLTQLGLMRLVYRRLLSNPVEADSISPMPLGEIFGMAEIFEMYDVKFYDIKARSGLEQEEGLPKDLHMELLATISFAHMIAEDRNSM